MILEEAVPVVVEMAVEVIANLVATPALTVTAKVFAVALMGPSVAEIEADSALYNTIDPVPTPFVKVIFVELPKEIAVLEALVTVGAVTGEVELLAPLKVNALLPA